MALIPDIKPPRSNTTASSSKPAVKKTPTQSASATPKKVTQTQPTKRAPWITRRKRIVKGIVGMFAFVLVLLAVAGWSAKTMYAEGMAGKDEFLAAQDAMKTQDFAAATEHLVDAEQHLINARKASRYVVWLKWLPWVSTQFKAVDNLLDGAIHIASGLQTMTTVAGDILSNLESDNASLSSITPKQRKAILEAISNSPAELETAQSELGLAVEYLEKVPDEGVIAPLAVVIIPIKENLPLIDEIVNKALPFLRVAPTILGYPEEQTYLFLLQNNSELRPTGGFIGTYGELILKNADIQEFKTDNIYNLDNPVKEELHISPPEPMNRFLGSTQWFMRDANWNPDFPTTAQKVEEFYHLENGPIEQIDGVIAVTPDFIKSLMTITGPITVDGSEYNSETLTDRLQYEVEVGYRQDGISDADRKQVIGDLAGEIMSRMLTLPKSQWGQLIEVLLKDLDQKHMILYSKNVEAQQLIQELEWGGSIEDHPGDFVMVVDANLAALKTDRVMTKNLEYSVQKEGDDYVATLTLKYYNDGVFDFFTTRYRSYTRIYVPQGSELIESSGFLSNDRFLGGKSEQAKVTQDEDVHKTVFEGFISVEPKSEDTITLRYKLPDTLRQAIEEGTYTLYAQKQSGTNNVTFTADLEFDHSIKLTEPIDGLEKISNNKVHFTSPLDTDKELTLEL